ncbi:hypothetical protein AGRA3207_007485 [Actinomadura graeca]|uniref:Uncharacterized protein n=1 Tax=Actinomadura graeca TaxID=2750812 RepID=A0ABX8R5V8_9ACTN|nr:hypothetical protein [Actinomadura graeca]QXJ25916.1 hypothetical protein AGRA3207_007485 [Actinomadura graeca]
MLRNFAAAADHGHVPGRPAAADGLREAFVRTGRGTAGDATGLCGVTYAVHNVPRRPGVFNILAVAPVADERELAALQQRTLLRIRPHHHRSALAFTPGVSHDLRRLESIGEGYHLAWAAINALRTDGTGVFQGPDVSLADGEPLTGPAVPGFSPGAGTPLSHDRVDLRGLLRMPFDTPAHLAEGNPARFALIYSMLRPPDGESFQTLNIHAAGPLRSAETYIDAAARIRGHTPAPQAQQAERAARSRAEAARRISTSGTPPRPVSQSPTPAAPRPRPGDPEPSPHQSRHRR